MKPEISLPCHNNRRQPNSEQDEPNPIPQILSLLRSTLLLSSHLHMHLEHTVFPSVILSSGCRYFSTLRATNRLKWNWFGNTLDLSCDRLGYDRV
jgi:hypothetical protein